MGHTKKHKILIIHNIIAPYKVALFNELYKLIPDLIVVFIAEKERRRDWMIDYSKINFPYELLFKGSLEDINMIRIAKRTWQILKKINSKSLVICDYSNIFGWISLFWGHKHANKMVFWLDSTRDDRKHYFPKEQIKQYFLKHFHMYLSPGSKTMDYLMFMGVDKNKILTTGYAVDNSFYLNKMKKINKSKLREKFSFVNTNKNFLYVGRLSKEKNIFTLLKAFKNLSDIDNQWGLLILGGGPQEETIKRYVVENGLVDRVYLFGFIQQNNIVDYYSFSDVFILPSISEPWGLVVNEAMLCQLPVIVSNKCGSSSELVKDGVNGFTFDPHDPKNLEDIMRGFIINVHNIDKFGTNSLEIIKQYSPKNVATKIYNNLVTENII